MIRHGHASLLLALFTLTQSASAAEPFVVKELRIQKVGDTTYFHVRLDTPGKKAPAGQERPDSSEREKGESLGYALPDFLPPVFEQAPMGPRLVSPDRKAHHIYLRPQGTRAARSPDTMGEETIPTPPGESSKTPMPRSGEAKKKKKPRDPVPVEGLEFIGKVQTQDEIKLVLLYPEEKEEEETKTRRESPITWKETSITLDLRKAKNVPLPAEAKERQSGPRPKQAAEHPVRDDLEGLWASAQVGHFAAMKGQAIDFGFPSFAATATGRKYNLPNQDSQRDLVPYTVVTKKPVIRTDPTGKRRMVYEDVLETRHRSIRSGRDQEDGGSRLFDMTTGAAAIAESLALRRMNDVAAREDGKRTVDVAKIKGIDVAEHPWEKMVAGKKPAEEPLAQLIPQDNYYLTFKNPRKLNDLGDLFSQTGDTLGKTFALQSRDYRIRERYSEQLCLKRMPLARRVGPLLVKSLAITGNDPYLREGSDLTIIFHTEKKALLLAALDRLVNEARQKHREALKETKSEHLGVTIESFVTPLREVSLHRAIVDDYVIYSNSPVGLRRVLDAQRGKAPRLADARDFQYMRTIFRNDDKEEDGFLFLSDAFIRQLVGPASKIKEKRRLEALTSLYMLTHGAIFSAWETGELPDSHRTVLAGANLRTEEVPMPEGKPAAWDSARQVAFSETYNTIHFATPLVELPMDRASQAEVEQYNRFRLEYLGLWRQYFDPIGIRFALTDNQVKVDTYILPLIKNSGYDALRRITGGGTFALDTGNMSPNTLFQFLMHLSPNVQDRRAAFGLEREMTELDLASVLIGALGPVGSWFVVRVDDSPVFTQLIDLAERASAGKDIDSDEMMRLVFQMPVVIGVDIKNPLTFGTMLAGMRTAFTLSLPGGVTWEPLEKPYKGVPIVRVQATPQVTAQLLGNDGKAERKRFQPAVYYAMIDGGFYLTLNEKMLHSLIDQMEARKKGEAKMVPINSSLYLAPGAAKEAGKLLRLGVDSRIHDQALSNLPLWDVLYRSGLVPEKTEPSQAREIAYRYLGFIPISPDGSTYRYDPAHDEIENTRHGSLRKPTVPKPSPDEPIPARLLDRLRSIRADLRFREDGIHTVLTIDRQQPKK
jgi:hypothetical protein